jgi:hypothetical protein
MQLGNDAMLADVAAAINEWIKAAKSYGVPVGKSHSNSPPGTVLAVGDRLTSADNDCTFCDVFGCKAKRELKSCVVFNSTVPIGAGSNFPKDMHTSTCPYLAAIGRRRPHAGDRQGGLRCCMLAQILQWCSVGYDGTIVQTIVGCN